MDEKPRPHRPWYQFSLRTMLIVMVISSAGFGCWVHWSREWIRQRHEFWDRHLAEKLIQAVPPRAPGGLWLFGEEGVHLIVRESDATPEIVDEVGGLFPEAQVVVSGMDGGSIF